MKNVIIRLAISLSLAAFIGGCATATNVKKQTNVMNIWIAPEYVPQERIHHPYISVAIYTQPLPNETKIAGKP